MPQLAIVLLIIALGSGTSGCSEPPAEKASKPQKTHLVETAEVRMDSAGTKLERLGTLLALREVQIVNQEQGLLLELPFSEGDQVKKGQLLAKLDDSLLQAELAKASALRAQAELRLQRSLSLHQQQLASDEEIDNLKTQLAVSKAEEQLLKTRIEYMYIKAPFSGVISQRLLEPGKVAATYTPLLTLSDTGTLITELKVSELLLNRFALNDKVDVKIDALGRQSYKGFISRIHPSIDPQTRNGTLEIQLTPVPQGARSGQLATVILHTRDTQRMLIPFKALRHDQQGDFVYIVKADKVEVSRVRSGLYIEENVEILQGLETGQQVVVKGFLDLKPGKKVEIVVNKTL